MGSIGHWGFQIELSVLKSRQIDDGFHGRPRLPQRLRDPIEVAKGAGVVFVRLAAPRLGDDTRIAVSQYHHRTLCPAAGAGVPLLIHDEPVLQCLVRNLLHPGIHRRVNLDTSLEQVLLAEIDILALEFVKDIVNDRGCPDQFVLFLVPDDRHNRALDGMPGPVRRNETMRHHQRQNLIPAIEDSPGLPRVGRVVTGRLYSACQQRGLVRIFRSEGGETPAKIVLRAHRNPVTAVSHVNQADVSGQ